MIALAAVLALVAALLHAGWNILLKEGGDPLALAVRAVGSSALICTPVALAAWFATGRPSLEPGAWPLAILSAGVEVLYFLALSEAYRRGDISLVYPIARGTAPTLAIVAGFVVLRETLHPFQIAAVVLLVAGMWTVRSPFRSGATVRPALLTGVCIATYTTIDRIGVRLGPPWLYGWAMWVSTAALLVTFVRFRRGTGIAWIGSGSPHEVTVTDGGRSAYWGTATLVGLLMTVAYLLILIALSIAPLAVVAPLRESAVVLVALWGLWRLHERGALVRLAGAALILGGIALLTLA